MKTSTRKLATFKRVFNDVDNTTRYDNYDNTIDYWFDGDRAFVTDKYLSQLIRDIVVHDCKWVINIFADNKKDFTLKLKHYNAAISELKKNYLTPPHLRDELSNITLLEWPTPNEFTTWIAAVVSPIYYHILNTKTVNDNFARQIIVDLLQSYYTEHPRIQADEFNEEALEKAFNRAL